MFAVFKNGKQASKAHPNQITAIIEAYELGAVVCGGRYLGLATGYEIKETQPKEKEE